jgi:hypothetical protein
MANEAKIVVSADDKASEKLTGITGKAKEMRGAFLAVGAAGGAVVGAIGLSIKSFAEAGDEIQKMALRTGLTTESLSELKFALEQSGSNIEGFEKGIRRMSSFIQDGRDGLTETTRALDSLGIAVTDFDGKSPEAAFEMLSNALAGVEDDLTQAALAQDIFGRSGTALLPMLAQGTDGIAALKQEAHDLGIVFDQDAANSAARLVDAQNTLKKSFEGVQFALADGLAPAISGAAEKFATIVSKVSEFARENPTLTKTIVALGLAFGGLAIGIAGVGLVLPIMATGLGFVTAGFIGLNVATGGIIIAIGALAAGIVLLIQNWDTVVDVIRKGVNIMMGGIETWVNGYIKGLNLIIDGVNHLAGVFGLEIGNISEVELPRWQEAMKETAEVVEDQTDVISEAFEETSDAAKKASDDISAILKAQNEAGMADALEYAENLVSSSEDRYAKLKEQRWQNVADEKAAATATIEELARMADAADALQKEEFAKVRAMVATLPEVISAGGRTGDASAVMLAFKASQNRVTDDLAAARAQLKSGSFGGGTTAAMVQAEIDRLLGVTGSEQYRGDRLGKLFEPEGGYGSSPPPMLPGMAAYPVVNINVSGSVVAEDLAATVTRGLREAEDQGY